VGERFQAALTGDGRARLPLRLIGAVEIFQRLMCGGSIQQPRKLLGELTLRCDFLFDTLTTFSQLAQIFEPHLHLA